MSKSATDGMRKLGEDVTSNFDHEICQPVVDALRAAPGKVYAGHSAWNFHGRVWFDGTNFQEEIWIHHHIIDVVSAATVEELRDLANSKWGTE